MHPDVGHLFIPTLHEITLRRPEGVVFENVSNYRTTFSAAAIRAHLSAIGYQLSEYVVNPFTDFNTATERVRWVMVASRLGRFSWDYSPVHFSGTIENLLDPVTDQDKADEFSPAQVAAHTKYCDRKASEGCGFSRRILTRQSVKVPTIPKSYGKIQPTGVFVSSGTSEGSYRLLRPTEVARIHGFDDAFIAAIAKLPRTTAYEVLGQGVVARPFEALGEAIGKFFAARHVQGIAA
jgi:site-specific DNA-cytosine methylase